MGDLVTDYVRKLGCWLPHNHHSQIIAFFYYHSVLFSLFYSSPFVCMIFLLILIIVIAFLFWNIPKLSIWQHSKITIICILRLQSFFFWVPYGSKTLPFYVWHTYVNCWLFLDMLNYEIYIGFVQSINASVWVKMSKYCDDDEGKKGAERRRPLPTQKSGWASIDGA